MQLKVRIWKDAEGGGCKLLLRWSLSGWLRLKDGLVFRRWEHEETGQELLLATTLLARKSCTESAENASNDPSAGHLGVTKTLKKVQRRFYWHGLREDVESHIRRCDTFTEVNDPPKLTKAPLISIKSGDPLQNMVTDTAGRFSWHGSREDVDSHIRRCDPRTEVNDPPKLTKAHPPGSVSSWVIPCREWHCAKNILLARLERGCGEPYPKM